MAVTQELLDKLQEDYAAGYTADDIIPALSQSENYPDIAAKIQEDLNRGYLPEEIYQAIIAAPPAEAPGLADEDGPLVRAVKLLKGIKGAVKAPGATIGGAIAEAPEAAGRGLAHGSFRLAKSVGTAVKMLGEGRKPHPEMLEHMVKIDNPFARANQKVQNLIKKVGERTQEVWDVKAKQYEAPEDIQGSIIDNPDLLKSPEWWAYNIGDMTPSMVGTIAAFIAGGPLAGGAVGGGLEGLGVYEEMIEAGENPDKARQAMLIMGAGSSVLNAVPLAKALQKVPGLKKKVINWLLAAGLEGVTEWLEEPWGAISKQIATGELDLEEVQREFKEGFNVFPVATLFGLLNLPAGQLRGMSQQQKGDVIAETIKNAPEEARTIFEREQELLADTLKSVGIEEGSPAWEKIMGHARQTRRDLDPLTGAQSRTEYEKAMPVFHKRAQEGGELSHVVFDIAGVGSMNAAMGKSKTDVHIKAIYDIIRNVYSTGETQWQQSFRHGGDEFQVVAPINKKMAEQLAEEATSAVREYVIDNNLQDIPSAKAGAPAGVDLYYAADSFTDYESSQQLIEQSDVALESIKKARKVAFAGEAVVPPAEPIPVTPKAKVKKPAPAKPLKAEKETFGKFETKEEYKPPPKKPERGFEMPELVELIKKISGRVPRVVKRLRRGAAGKFTPETGKIDIKADLFRQPEVAEWVTSHEGAHLFDFMPQKTMARGNILGRIASMEKFFKDYLAGKPGGEGELTGKDRVKLRREARRLAEEEQKKAEKSPEEKVQADDVLSIWNDVTSREKNARLYDFISSLNTKQKLGIIKDAMKGEVNFALPGEKGKSYFDLSEAEKKIYRGLIRKEIRRRNLFEREQIEKELQDLSMRLKPFNIHNEKKRRYRFSAPELYADGVSAILKSPNLAKQEAPTFFKAFFTYFETKPEIQSVYDELQSRMYDPEKLLGARQDNLETMAAEGERKKLELEKARRPKFRGMMHGLYETAIEKNADVYHLQRMAIKEGKTISERDKPSYSAEEIPYIEGEQYVIADAGDKFIPNIQGLTKEEVSRKLHAYMLLRRQTTERRKLAGPAGFQAKVAERQLTYMRKKMGSKDFLKIKNAVENWDHYYRQNVLPVIETSKMWTDELMSYARANLNYGKFEIHKRVDEKYGPSVSTHVFKQYGTEQDITNVYNATVMQAVSLIRAARINLAKQDYVNFLQEMFPDEIVPAKTQWNGKYDDPIAADKAGHSDKGLLVTVKNGKMEGYYVPKSMADAFQYDPKRAGAVSKIVQAMTAPLRAIMVSHNPRWMAANMIRDYFRSFKNLPGIRWYRPFQLMRYYKRARKEALKAAFEEGTSELEKEMLVQKALVADRIFSPSDIEPESALDRKLQSFGRDPEKYQNEVVDLMARVWRRLGKEGKFSERWGKMASYLYLKEKFPTMAERQRAHIVRGLATTPDVKRGGTGIAFYNNLWMFSNVGKEGLRSDLEAFRMSVKERRAALGLAEGAGFGKRAWANLSSDYVIKTIMTDVMPKVMLFLAAQGLLNHILGDDVEEVVKKTSNYFKSNYNVVPMGLTKSGKAVILTIPQDYTGQIIGGLTWNVLNREMFGKDALTGTIMEGQPYGLNPWITASMATFQYMNDTNPLNTYSGYPAVPESIFKAKDYRSHLAFGKYLLGELGVNAIYRFDTDDPERIQTEIEKFMEFPPNIIGRFMRITNAGEREEHRRIKEEAGVTQYRNLLDVKEAIVKSIDKAKGKPDIDDALNVYFDMLDQGKLAETVSFRQFNRRYQRYAQKAKNTPKIEAFVIADNRQRAALLRHFRDTLKPAEFEQLVDQLISEGWVKKGALDKYYDEGE